MVMFQTQYKSMKSKLDNTVEGLIPVLKYHGITLPTTKGLY